MVVTERERERDRGIFTPFKDPPIATQILMAAKNLNDLLQAQSSRQAGRQTDRRTYQETTFHLMSTKKLESH